MIESQTPPESSGDQPARRGVPLWAVIVIAAAALLFGGLIIVRVAAPLAGLLNPADPPFFQPAALLEHRAITNGVDEWLYGTDESPCAVYVWYEAQADYCRPSPHINCSSAESAFSPAQDEVFSVGYCYGTVPFGDFTADWEIYISAGYNDADGQTRYLIAREVDWINQD